MNQTTTIILDLAEQHKYSEIKGMISELAAADIAPVFEELGEDSRPVIYRLLPKELAAEVFVEIDYDLQEQLISRFSDAELKAVFDELFLDDTVDILEEMPANVVKRILKHTDPSSRKVINELLKYPKNSAGSVMTTEFVDLKGEMTVKDAFDRIRKTGVDKETVYTCYVTDSSRRLLGVVTVKDLLLASYEDTIESIMEQNVIYVKTGDDREYAASLFDKYGFLALPVTDNETRLVGIITVDDAIEVIIEESSEDMQVLAAITPDDTPYLKSSIFEIFKSRIPWLMLLMLSSTFTGIIIAAFESKLALIPALIGFIPMLMGTGGNSGSQSSVTVIRALSLGDIEWRDLPSVVWKEIRVSVLCGICLSAVNFAKIYLVDYMLLNNVDNLTQIAVVCAALACTVFFAKTVGAVMPMVAKKFGLDPAVMASPLITTIVDAVSLLIYFGFAMLLLNI